MTQHRWPQALSEIMGEAAFGERAFLFRRWAEHTNFVYPNFAGDFLSNCESAAEAYFVLPFTQRLDFSCLPPSTTAKAGELWLRLQVPCGVYRIDAVVGSAKAALAVEIDGHAFHHRSQEQVASDYARQRRIVLEGYPVIRFAAAEVFDNAEQCWREIDSIIRRQAAP